MMTNRFFDKLQTKARSTCHQSPLTSLRQVTNIPSGA